MTDPDRALLMQKVTFGFGRLPVIEDVDLTVDRGELLSVVGPNGGGKTTLLRLILGLIRPQRGSIHVLGTRPVRARPLVGYMPQHTLYDPHFPATVTDVVLMGRAERHAIGFYNRNDRHQAHHALEEVGLADLAERQFSRLSGGQRQRVLMARALAAEPELLLLDEPMANVDPASEALLGEILKQLNRRMTILLVSHDLGFVANFVRKVVCVNRRVVIHPTSEITGDIVSDLYGVPQRMVRHDRRHTSGAPARPSQVEPPAS